VAKSVGLEIDRFQKDLDDRRLLAKLAEDHTFAADTLGVFGTPTLVFPEEQAVFVRLPQIPPPDESLAVFAEVRHLAERRQYIQEIKRPQRPGK
jgi:predicted DsbA family dithiol-disulfide isomerase